MFKNNQKQSESDLNSERASESSEFDLSTLIGVGNSRRWKAIKVSMCLRTNEEFVAKLLDLAEEYLKSIGKKVIKLDCNKKIKKIKNKSKVNIGVTNINTKKDTECSINTEINIKTNYNVKNIIGDNILEKNKDQVINNDSINRTNKTDLKTDEINDDKHIVNDKNADLLLPLKNSDTNKSTNNNVDKIRIKLCHLCNTHHIQDKCPINHPNLIINDALTHENWTHKYKSINELETDDDGDTKKYTYANLSLPDTLRLRETTDFHGLGVFSKCDLDKFTQFGPLVGKIVKEMEIPEDVNMKNIWEVVNGTENVYYDTENSNQSNWVKYIRPAPTRDEKNLTAITKNSKLYFVTVKNIKSGDELLFWQESAASCKKKMEKTACGGCNIDFTHPHYYRIHCSIFHDVRYSLTIKKYHCKVCGAAVLGKENIMKHATELHNGQGVYQCQFCKKFFLRLNYLEMHRTYGCSANPHRSKPLCDFCGRKFCQPQKLKMHIKRMHGDLSEVLKEFQCKSCLKILGSRAALQRHAKEVHKKQTEGNISCSRCGKSFQNKSNLKIHMLTHSGIKPFKCTITICNAAFTTKQCLQFHYKKIHNFTEDNMPKIERSVDYTFQAYSGDKDKDENNKNAAKIEDEAESENRENKDVSSDEDSDYSENIDDPLSLTQQQQQQHQHHTPPTPPPPPPHHKRIESPPIQNESKFKIHTKGSKKWIGGCDNDVNDDNSDTIDHNDHNVNNVSNNHPHKLPDIYPIEKVTKDLSIDDLYDRNKLSNDYTRHEASNASLLVEAALDSVCNEPTIDIDVSTTPNCAESLVNIYNLTQHEYGDSRDISLNERDISLNERDISLNDNYNFQQFSPQNSPDLITNRSNFVRNYINSLSPHNNNAYDNESKTTPISPSRYLFTNQVNADLSSDDNSDNGIVQNLSLHDANKDLSVYNNSNNKYSRKINLSNEDVDVIDDNLPDRDKFDLDLDLRIKPYNDSVEADLSRHRYDNESDFRVKYDLINDLNDRIKYDAIDVDFRADRTNFEPSLLVNSDLQGLDMSARSFHTYSNINRYRPLYPEVDRIDLRLNYSPPPPPPPPSYAHADLLRVVSLDLTPPGRHSVDLTLRNHPLHSRLLLDQTRILNHDLITQRHLSDTGTNRILTDHSTSRILNAEQVNNHLITPPSDDSRILLDQSRLIEGRILSSGSGNGAVSPAQGFGTYGVAQNPYHPAALGTRTHVTSPTTAAAYHYPSYY